jgi:hypothetical protein
MIKIDIVLIEKITNALFLKKKFTYAGADLFCFHFERDQMLFAE